MKTRLLIVVAMTLAACSTVRGDIYTLGSPVVNPANQHAYILLSNGSWTDSEAAAQALGGHLATINDQAEDLWILNTFSPMTGLGANSYFWIGFYNPSQNLSGGTHASNFVWVDGSPVGYTYWYPGQPSNSGGNEFYASIRAQAEAAPTGSWNDLPNTGGGQSAYHFGVVEVVPEPSAAALIGLGLLASLVFRQNQQRRG